MGDVLCKVCSEPWDAYGIYHGDMTRWKAKLLLKGAGCPSCEGESPFETPTPVEQLAGHEDPVERAENEHYRSLLNAAVDDDLPLMDLPTKVEWKCPDPKALWSCAGCEVEVIRDPATDYPDGDLHGKEGGELSWNGGQRVHYSGGLSHSYGEGYNEEDPTEEPPFTLGEDHYCPGCAEWCPDCREVILFKRDELDGGEVGSFLVDSDDFHRCRSVCESCYYDWEGEQESEQDFDEEDDSSDWEE